jgi:uncharacterized membrane protein
MSKYAVVVFPDESKAYEGMRSFKELHDEGSLTLYGIAVIAKDADGNVSVKESQDEGPVGTALGMLTGALVGVLAGPAGVAVGAAGGGMVGSMFDLANVGVGIEFVDLVGSKMKAGTAAILAEVEEYWTTPLDTRMEALGGTILRQQRLDFEDEQFSQGMQALSDELDELAAETEEASDETKANLEAKKDAVARKLEETREKGRKKVEQWESEQKAKLEKLQGQAGDATAEAKVKILKRMKEYESKHDARMAKLKEKLT